GALALGLTRWEMVRGVVLPYTRGGVVAAIILGFGRAVGEAIAVTQVIGGVLGIHLSLFAGGDTLASRIAAQYQGAASKLQLSSLVYLAVILLAISLVGSIVIVLCAAAIAVPVGVLVAIYLSELAPKRLARAISLVLDVLNGLPSIVIGIFVFALLVVGHGQSALKAAFALAIIM